MDLNSSDKRQITLIILNGEICDAKDGAYPAPFTNSQSPALSQPNRENYSPIMLFHQRMRTSSFYDSENVSGRVINGTGVVSESPFFFLPLSSLYSAL